MSDSKASTTPTFLQGSSFKKVIQGKVLIPDLIKFDKHYKRGLLKNNKIPKEYSKCEFIEIHSDHFDHYMQEQTIDSFIYLKDKDMVFYKPYLDCVYGVMGYKEEHYEIYSKILRTFGFDSIYSLENPENEDDKEYYEDLLSSIHLPKKLKWKGRYFSDDEGEHYKANHIKELQNDLSKVLGVGFVNNNMHLIDSMSTILENEGMFNAVKELTNKMSNIIVLVPDSFLDEENIKKDHPAYDFVNSLGQISYSLTEYTEGSQLGYMPHEFLLQPEYAFHLQEHYNNLIRLIGWLKS